MSQRDSLIHQRGPKDPNCPECHGRSFDASGCDDRYHECQLCEVPTAQHHDWYRSKWPEIYAKWAEGRC